ncbi:MAG: hypothetical protein IPP88_02875 [Betaproteobacteria bacterium]|nr:hypothetical protein [Betaproteobacteria bacterium]
MNNATFEFHEAHPPDPLDLRWDQLDEVTGIMWGSLVGGTIWLMALALVLLAQG